MEVLAQYFFLTSRCRLLRLIQVAGGVIETTRKRINEHDDKMRERCPVGFGFSSYAGLHITHKIAKLVFAATYQQIELHEKACQEGCSS